MNVEQGWGESLTHPCSAGSWCRWWPGDRHRSRNSSWRLGWQSCTTLLRLASSRIDWLLHICLHVFTWLALPRRRILMWRRHSPLAGHGLPNATLWSWWWTGVGRWRCARWHLWQTTNFFLISTRTGSSIAFFYFLHTGVASSVSSSTPEMATLSSAAILSASSRSPRVTARASLTCKYRNKVS